MALIDRINKRINELEIAEDEHRDHNRIGYANQTKMIRWELQGLLQDECDGKNADAGENTLPIQRVSGSFLDELIEKHKGNKKLALENCKKMKDTDQYPWYDATFNNELLFVHDLEDLKCRSGL